MPVSKSDFVPLHPKLGKFNVQVDLGGVGAFRYLTRSQVVKDVVYGDFQTTPGFDTHGRYGSGRAGLYGGKYLKGIGRTLLAGNWNRIDDRENNCGSLYPSFAIREVLVTAYLQAKRASDLIVPCEGLLLRPRDPALISSFDKKVRPIDQRFQAITVKQAGFSRFSNLVWLASHVDFTGDPTKGTQLSQFFSCFMQALEPAASHDLDSITPQAIADALARSFERISGAYQRSWQTGVYFHYPHNNHTADGRICDLESHWILGGPIIATTSPRNLQEGFLALVQVLDDFRILLRWFHAWNDYVAKAPAPVRPGQRGFADAVKRALCDRFGKNLGYYSDERIKASIITCARSALDLGREDQRRVGEVVMACLKESTTGARAPEFRAHPTPLPRVGNLGRGRRKAIVRLAGPPPSQRAVDECRFIEQIQDELEMFDGDIDEVLARIRGAVRRVRRECAPSSAR